MILYPRNPTRKYIKTNVPDRFSMSGGYSIGKTSNQGLQQLTLDVAPRLVMT
jgi:hypothetical protein